MKINKRLIASIVWIVIGVVLSVCSWFDGRTGQCFQAAGLIEKAGIAGAFDGKWDAGSAEFAV